jgi:hypothetical protein
LVFGYRFAKITSGPSAAAGNKSLDAVGSIPCHAILHRTEIAVAVAVFLLARRDKSTGFFAPARREMQFSASSW